MSLLFIKANLQRIVEKSRLIKLKKSITTLGVTAITRIQMVKRIFKLSLIFMEDVEVEVVMIAIEKAKSSMVYQQVESTIYKTSIPITVV